MVIMYCTEPATFMTKSAISQL